MTRTSPQLRAAALESIARGYLCSRGESMARGRGRTNVNVVYDIGGLDISDPTLAALARADAAHGQRLSRTTLERLMCDCYISRVITDGPSNILDVGRLTRTVSNALWTALIVRDGHCTEKGCTLGPDTARRTTSGTGNTAAPPTSTTSSCCAGTTTNNDTFTTPKPAPDNAAPITGELGHASAAHAKLRSALGSRYRLIVRFAGLGCSALGVRRVGPTRAAGAPCHARAHRETWESHPRPA